MLSVINIYAFWIGNETIAMKNNIRKIEKDSRFNLILGPSSDDHSYLMSNCKFYETSFKEKKYAFCSDVWRFWKLRNNPGLYIDIHTIINFREMDRFCEYTEKYNYIFIFENNYVLLSGVFFSKEKNSKLLNLINDYYFALENCNLRPTSCYVLSKFIFNRRTELSHILFLPPTEISQDSKFSLFNNRSMGSWTSLSSQMWKQMLADNIEKFNRFSKNIHIANWTSKVYVKNYFIWQKAEHMKSQRSFFMFWWYALYSKLLNIILLTIK